MQACIDVAFPYAHVRDAFGKKIGEHQVNNSHLVLFHHFVNGLICFSMILPIIIYYCAEQHQNSCFLLPSACPS